MTKIYSWIVLVSLIFLSAGCYDDSDLKKSVDDLDQRVTELEKVVNQLNSNVNTLSELMTGKTFIESIEDQGNGVKVINLITANGEKKTLEISDGKDGKDGKDGLNGNDGKDGKDGLDGKDGKDGKDGLTPQVSVRQDSDGNYYWTINGEWLIVNGKKVRANGIDGLDGKDGKDGKDGLNGQDGKDGKDGKDGQDGKDGKDGENGIAPAFRIENGRWMVSLDRGITWYDCGQATGKDGDSFFKDAQMSEDGDYAFLTLSDGTVLTFEIYRQFNIAFDIKNVLVQEGQTKDINFTVTGMTKTTEVEAIGKRGFDADVKLNSDGSGVLTVMAPDKVADGSVIVLLSNGKGKTIMRTLSFVSGIVNISDKSVEMTQEGGTAEITVETDLEFTITVPKEASDWIKVVSGRALRTEKFQVVVSPSNDPESRSALLTIESSSGKPLESILVIQKPTVLDPSHLALRVDPSQAPATGVGLFFSSLSIKGGKIYIDWGDGSEVQSLAASSSTSTSLASTARYPKHVYADKTRKYIVQCWGDFNQISATNANYFAGVTEILQWGNIPYTGINIKGEQLVKVCGPKGKEFANTSSVKFDGCKKLKYVSPKLLSGISNKFYSFNTMFRSCESLEEIPEGFFDPVTKLTSVQDMFYGCRALKSVKSGFKNVTDVGTSFSNSAIGVFKYCNELKGLPDQFLPEKYLERVNNINSFFQECYKLESVPSGFFKGLGEGKNTSGKTIEVNILNMMFYKCTSLKSVDLSFLNTPGCLKVYAFNSMFSGCTELTTAIPSYTWEYDGKKYDIKLWERENYTGSSDAAMATAAKTVFSTRSYNGTDCFKDCSSLPGYDKIPSGWGGADDGYYQKPGLTVETILPEGKEYYQVDFRIKTKQAASLFYYLADKESFDKSLPRHGNSMEQMALEAGIEIRAGYDADYIAAANSERGLTLEFEGGMPGFTYCMAVVAVNPRGKTVAFAQATTTPMPKGCDDFEAFVGSWNVKSASTLIEQYDENGDPIDVGPTNFEVTIVPNRVDENYLFYGWGTSIFSNKPMLAHYNKATKSLELYNGTKGACEITRNYPFSKEDDPNAIFTSYNVLYYPYLENPKDHSINYWGSGQTEEMILKGRRVAGMDKITLVGQRSAYNSSQQVGDVYWRGLEAVLSMGSYQTSQLWTPVKIIRPQYVVNRNGESFVPHHMAPYTLTRKANSDSEVKAARKSIVKQNSGKTSLKMSAKKNASKTPARKRK